VGLNETFQAPSMVLTSAKTGKLVSFLVEPDVAPLPEKVTKKLRMGRIP